MNDLKCNRRRDFKRGKTGSKDHMKDSKKQGFMLLFIKLKKERTRSILKRKRFTFPNIHGISDYMHYMARSNIWLLRFCRVFPPFYL